MTPFGDGTGPLGQGPAGKGLGPCGGGQRRGRRGGWGRRGSGWNQQQGEQVQPPPAPDTAKESKAGLQSELQALQQRVRQLESLVAAKTSSSTGSPAST